MLQRVLKMVQAWLLTRAWAEVQKWVRKLVMRLLTNETSLTWARTQGQILGVQIRHQIPGDVSEPIVAAFFEGLAEGIRGEFQDAPEEPVQGN